jgi:agmatine/peptidylarginine deiminase
MIRYIDKNKVLITNYKDYNEKHYNEMMKVLGPKPKGSGFNVISLHFSDLEQFKNNKLFSVLLDRSWCYINYLQVGTRILVPRLGYDLLDNEALKQIREAFSANEDEIELISQDMTSIVEDMNDEKNSGGALNCLTWTIQS